MEIATDFIFLGFKITVDRYYSHEIKRYLLLGRKTMTNLDSIKDRDITLLTKDHIVKAMVFLIVIYRCESWTIRKIDHWRNDAFKLWCWRKFLRVLLNCKEIKPVNPKGNHIHWIFIGRTDADGKAPILWLPVIKSWLIGKSPDAGKDGR